MPPSEKNIDGLLREATRHLQAATDSPRLDAELLLAYVLRRDRVYLYTYPESLPPADQRDCFHALLQRRRQGEPLAYLTGFKEFWSLSLSITPQVLIPRPETELLVELALACFTQQQSINVADLGTGSGAIALALAHERPHWRITATDISTPALEVARSNAQMLENVQFLAGHWFVPLNTKRLHLIISNPPYIDSHDPHLQQPELRHEPQQALVSPAHGLKDIMHIIDNTPQHLLAGGFLILEHGFDQGSTVRKRLRDKGFSAISTHHDLAGHERATLARWDAE
ncbi:MAG: peptide chain release factor N(5)-glutamine methyltransferase [Gammaproteobacteria bacterium]|nr:peptide chain release factor N(5)-glutamine methyltransferase [Gammaproteobacteria bacterium]